LRLQSIAASITEGNQRICIDLFEHRVLTTIQLYELHFPSCPRARKRLLELHRLGLLWRTRPQRQTGSLPRHYVLDEPGALVLAESRGIEPNELGYRFDRALGMLDSSRAALIGDIASVIGSALTYLVAIRLLRRSVSTTNGAPLGPLLETRLGGLEHCLKRLKRSLSEVSELLAHQRRRSASSLWSPISRPPEPVWSPRGR
jgi:hypothetical protein